MIRLARPEDFAFACPLAASLLGEGPIHHCDLCNEPVIDLSAITEAEAEALTRQMAGRSLCVRVRVEAQRVVHRPRHTALRRVTLALGLGIGGLALAQWGLSTPADRSAAAQPAGGAVGHTASAPGVLERAVEAAIADAIRLNQPPETTRPPRVDTLPTPAPADPVDTPCADPSDPAPTRSDPAQRVAPTDARGVLDGLGTHGVALGGAIALPDSVDAQRTPRVRRRRGASK